MEIKINKILIGTLLILLMFSCKTGKELMMPFKNHQYSGSRLFPVEKSNVSYSFRVWMSSSTSVDRVISISKDKEWGDQSSVIEYGSLTKKTILGEKSVSHFEKKNIIPKSGIDGFIEKVNGLRLETFEDQEKPLEIALHQPLSLYIVEIKDGDNYNSFRFQTYFPDSTLTNSKYDAIQDLLFDEFNFSFY